MLLVALTNFGKDLTHKKNAIKNAYLGSIFIPEKCVFRVCFEKTFTRMISSLKYKCPQAKSLYKALLFNGGTYY